MAEIKIKITEREASIDVIVGDQVYSRSYLEMSGDVECTYDTFDRLDEDFAEIAYELENLDIEAIVSKLSNQSK